MTNERPIEWADLDSKTRDAAIRTVMRVGRVKQVEAEDVVADALVKLMSSRPLVRSPRNLLIKTSLHELYARRARVDANPIRFEVTENLEPARGLAVREGLIDPSLGPLPQIVEGEAEAVRSTGVHDALSRMSAADRELLRAYYFEDRVLTDIDRERGEEPGTARVRLHRARERFLRVVCLGADKPGPAR